MRALAVCLGFFLVMLDSTIVTVALPSIGGGTATLQWVVDAYTVVFAALVLAGGSFADRFGARRSYHGGMTIFALGSVMCACTTGGAWLIAGRVVQGVGAAVLMPSSLALIRSTYPEPARQARVIGLWGGLAGVAAAAGPLLGGALLAVAGWPALFLLNVPFAVLVLCIGRGLVDPPRHAGARVDVRGLVTSTCGLALLVAGCIAAHPPLIAAGALVLGLFVLLQYRASKVLANGGRRRPAPMLRPDLLRHRALRATVVTGFALNFAFYGQFFLVTLYLQEHRHLSPLLTGVALAVQAAGAVVGSPFGGWAGHRYGPRATMLAGLLTGAAGFAALGACAAGPLPAVLAALFVVGFGIDTAMTAATSLTLQAAPDGHAGVASGLLNTMRQVGSALGVAVLGAVGAFPTAMLIATGTYLAAALLVALRTGPTRPAGDPAGTPVTAGRAGR